MPERIFLFRRFSLIIVRLVLLVLLSCTSDAKKSTTKPEKKSTVKRNRVSLMDSLKFKKPTISWQKMINEGQDFYTPGDILESDKLLDKYLDNLSAAKNSSEIWKAVVEVVTGFNNLNIRNNDFIQTVEREELAEFIQVAAEVYGLKYDGDITEQWRMEW